MTDSTGTERESLLQTQSQVVSTRKEWILARHVLSLLGFFGFANVYAMRVNLSVAIVAMVNNTGIPAVDTNSTDICPSVPGHHSHSNREGEFNWDEKTQGLILGSFFWGYIVTNPIGGRLAEVYGGRVVFGFGVFVTSLLTLLTPLAARTSIPVFVVLRVVMGLGEGVTFPAMNAMLAKWIPRTEKSRTTAWVYAGASLGTVVSLPICGLLCQSFILGGWPSAFYVFGALGLIWTACWMSLIHDTPDLHPRISEEEKAFIHTANNTTAANNKVLPVPYKAIFKSMPFWAILVAHVTQNWGFYTLLTEIPTYMNNILHFNIRDNGMLAALPYLVSLIVSIICGRLADMLIIRSIFTVTTARRVFNSIAFFSSMICLVLAGYSGCDAVLTVTLLTLAVGINGAVFAGYMNSHIDIAPNYAGTLMGFTNCAATIPGFVGPAVVGLLINGSETLTRWRIVFSISAVTYFVGNVFFLIFVSGDEQWWNKMYEENGNRTQTAEIRDMPNERPQSRYGATNARSILDSLDLYTNRTDGNGHVVLSVSPFNSPTGGESDPKQLRTEDNDKHSDES